MDLNNKGRLEVDKTPTLKWYYDNKIISFFSSDSSTVFAEHATGKMLSFEFYPKAVYFERKQFGFDGPPLLTLKTDR